ncbi:MAG TPA: extracellular solute-binding protein, partial [Firmicutes bacterium]|nr:extracellular solute-binding protein [Bacillota bacterium]
AIEALRFYRDLYTVHKVVPNPLEYHREQLPELFAAGRIAMFVSGPWGGRSVGRPPQNPKTPYAAALLPAGPEGIATELVSDCTGIYSKTKHPKEAWLLLDFITSEQEQIFRDKIGGLVPQGPKIAGLPEFQKDPYFSTFIKMAQYGVPQPQPLRWEPMQKIIVEMIQKVLLQKATPEQAVKEAAREIEEQGLVPASSKK